MVCCKIQILHDAIVMMYSMICKDCSMNAVAMVSFLPLKCVILFSLLSTAFRVHFEVCATKYKHFCNRLWHHLLWCISMVSLSFLLFAWLFHNFCYNLLQGFIVGMSICVTSTIAINCILQTCTMLIPRSWKLFVSVFT